ncbi:uncharacterized protein LOC122852854 isoform X2 [Aphidius gifuensis]|nr:uncharacterized protein LOC122852854 isoform X2 [Aphidius gifuensis]XP_044008871.1 uncharacterized protein LOC122852854 isoform X2 [Aphidius gifuensis]
MEHVNDDCLAEIFMYVPTCERPKIALVCKKWKSALDNAWFNIKKLEFTYWRYDEYPHFLKKNYPTVDGQFNFLKSLLYNCGRYLRELDLSVYPKCNILPVINEYCPNLEKLRIRIDYIDDTDRAIFNNAFIHLTKLKVLKIIFDGCLSGEDSLVPTALINSLLNVADTLIDLNISKWSESISDSAVYPEEITSVMTQLKALRQFGTAGIHYPDSLADLSYYMNNYKTKRFFSDDSCYISQEIDRKELFEKIEVLNIMSGLIPDDIICNIANTMKRLHTLHASCQWLTNTAIVTCTKINNLKFINLLGYNNVINDSSIKLLKNLTHLKVPFSNKITDESIIKVLENSPEMQSFSLKNTGITHKFIEKAAEISRNRKRELRAWVTLECDKAQVEYNEYLTVRYVKNQEQRNENYITY